MTQWHGLEVMSLLSYLPILMIFSVCRKLADNILKALATITELQGHAVKIGASIGISLYPADSCDPDTLLELADMGYVRSQTKRQK